MNVWIADPVTVAAMLNVPGQAVTVVPAGKLGPVTVAPTKDTLQPVIVPVNKPAIEFTFSCTVMFGGTLFKVHAALATATVAPMAVPTHWAFAECGTTDPRNMERMISAPEVLS